VLRRPPAAVEEARFLERCDGCGKCISACAAETGVLRPDRAGAPVLELGERFCTFCGACVRACPTGALDPALAEQVELGEWAFPWRMFIREEACLETTGTTCRMCESACEWSAIRFRPLPGFRWKAWIEIAACTGCGECLPRCPRKAIAIIEEEAVSERLAAAAAEQGVAARKGEEAA
jgi:ferredoxin-type protein NapF